MCVLMQTENIFLKSFYKKQNIYSVGVYLSIYADV